MRWYFRIAFVWQELFSLQQPFVRLVCFQPLIHTLNETAIVSSLKRVVECKRSFCLTEALASWLEAIELQVFQRIDWNCMRLCAYTAFDSEIAFAILLGPTDPCSIAVSMEPFSTLALKGLTWVFATTTKICTIGGSRQDHSLIPFNATNTTLLHVGTYQLFIRQYMFQRRSISSTLELLPFSGRRASASELLHTP